MPVLMQILICVSWLSIDSGVQSAIFIWGDQHVKKWHGTIFSRFFTCKMDVIIYGIDVFKEGTFLWFLDDSKGIIYKPFPQCRGDGAVARALFSRSSMNKFATIGLMEDPISAPLTCSYSLPWKVKYVVLRQNSSRQDMCFTVMDVLWCKSLSSSRCFFMMDIAGSIGTDLKSASTPNDIIHSSGCSWMPSRLCMKSMNMYLMISGHFHHVHHVEGLSGHLYNCGTIS